MAPLLLDVNAPEFAILVVIAIILFGPEKLPDLARRIARVVRYVRVMAGNAQSQLSRELGPDFENLDFRDLQPKSFVRKHLLDDVSPIVADVKSEITDAGRRVTDQPGEVSAAIDGARVNGATAYQPAAGADEPPSPAPSRTPFDPDAT